MSADEGCCRVLPLEVDGFPCLSFELQGSFDQRESLQGVLTWCLLP